MLAAEQLDVFYGGIQALRGVSLDVREGELVTLIGANGAGKSTTLKTIAGILAPKSGKVRFNGAEIQGRSSHLILRDGLALCPEGRRIFPNLTVDENLDLGAYVRHDAQGVKDDVARWHATFPILKERARQLAGTLSGGEQQMLAIARALMSRPKVLMLDEPSLGLAPKLVDQIFAVLKELKGRGVTILLVEQNARQALEVADRGYVLETGRIVKHGPASDLSGDPAVRKAYLGG
ncbi:MAG: ABC transporter ATP-binding protein [Planctomycetota bacterium]|nr:ABC transporter ATP-binding protein [Planctomycetota bacterium]